jgi:hypothetical protein
MQTSIFIIPACLSERTEDNGLESAAYESEIQNGILDGDMLGM